MDFLATNWLMYGSSPCYGKLSLGIIDSSLGVYEYLACGFEITSTPVSVSSGVHSIHVVSCTLHVYCMYVPTGYIVWLMHFILAVVDFT